MTVKTKGDTLFEEFCKSNNIRCAKIPECEQHTPDYSVVLNGATVFVEVKQIDEDVDFTAASGSRTTGAHVRAKINDARDQVKAVLNQRVPAILLIYNNLDPLQMFGTQPHDFIAAMYGERTAAFNRDNRTKGFYHGRNQSFRKDKNTSFSAVGSIYQAKTGPTVLIYENIYAEHRLDFSSLPDCIETQGFVEEAFAD